MFSASLEFTGQNVFDFLKSATTTTLLIVSSFLLIVIVASMVWVQRSDRDIKLWGFEATMPESDAVKACKAVQSSEHDLIQTLSNEMTSHFNSISGDSTALNALASERIDAAQRDGPYSNHYESIISSRADQLESDEDYQGKMIDWLRGRISDETARVYASCGMILQKDRASRE